MCRIMKRIWKKIPSQCYVCPSLRSYLGGSVHCAPPEQQLLNLMFCEHTYLGTLACWKCGVQEGKHCFLRAKHSNTESHPEGVLFGESGRRQWVHLINGLLHRICYQIGLDTLDSLLGFVKEQSLHVEDTTQTTSDFTDGERELLALFEDCNGITKSQCFSIHPPMSVASLVHWRIISNLLQLLLPAGQRDVISTVQELTYSGIV